MLIQLRKNIALLWILRILAVPVVLVLFAAAFSSISCMELWEPLAGCCLSSAVLPLCWRCWMDAMVKQQLLLPLHF